MFTRRGTGSEKKEDPFKLPNCIPIAESNVKIYQPYLDRLRQLVAEAKSPNAAPAAPPSADGDFVTKLASLKELHEAGALSDDEFAAAKARLLS